MATPTETYRSRARTAAAAGIATLLPPRAGITLLILQVLGHRFGILDHVAPPVIGKRHGWYYSRYAGIATFACRRTEGVRATSSAIGGQLVTMSLPCSRRARSSLSTWQLRSREISSTPGTIDVSFSEPAPQSPALCWLSITLRRRTGARRTALPTRVFTLLRRFPVWLPITVSVALFALLHPAQAQGGLFLPDWRRPICFAQRLAASEHRPSCLRQRLAVAWAAREWQQ